MKSAPGLSASVLLVLSAVPVSGQQPSLHRRLEAPVDRAESPGHPVATSGNTVSVGAPHHGTCGAAHVLEKTVADRDWLTDIVYKRILIRGGSL